MKTLIKRRRRESKTNYTKRLILLKGDIPRLVVRKTNRYIILQIVKSESAQDKVVSMVNSKELLKKGWPEDKKGSLKSLAAAYLSGILVAKKGKNKGISQVILDSGLIPNSKRSRVYAVVKGVADGGLNIPFDDSVLPSDEMINKYEFVKKIKGEIK